MARLRLLGKVTGAAAVALIVVLLLYGVAGWIGSSLPRNAGRVPPADGVTILVESNAIHTALVLPVVTAEKDWRSDFPLAHVDNPQSPYTHVSVSWGEHDVFLKTPTWWDLQPGTVLRAIGFGGTGALHVAHYVRPGAGESARALVLSRAEYVRLVRAIEARLPALPRVRHPGYARYDVFYDTPAAGYSALYTCNQWTSDVLAEAGVTTGRWTPFAGGVMKWVPPAPHLAADQAP